MGLDMCVSPCHVSFLVIRIENLALLAIRDEGLAMSVTH